MIKSLIGQRIRMLRTRAGYSQKSFAKVCGLDRTYIAEVELGKGNISIENLNKIAVALNLTLSELCDVSSPSNRTILLKINGETFIVEGKTELTTDLKEEIEIICRCAYDNDSEFATQLTKEEINDRNLYDMNPYEIADIFAKVFKDTLNIDVVFKASDIEVSINLY